MDAHETLLDRDRRYLRRHEVAERLAISTSTLDRWVRDGLIPTVPHPVGRGRGRVVHFDWREVRRAVREIRRAQ